MQALKCVYVVLLHIGQARVEYVGHVGHDSAFRFLKTLYSLMSWPSLLPNRNAADRMVGGGILFRPTDVRGVMELSTLVIEQATG